MARPKASSTPSTTKSHKRQLSASATHITPTPGARSSKRLKDGNERTPTGKATPTKSKYFEATDSEEIEENDVSESGYEDEDASMTEPSLAPSESEDDYDSEEIRKPKKRVAPKGQIGRPAGEDVDLGSNSKDLWRPGVKAGLGPGKQVFIEKPKPRGDGGVRYAPDKIHPNTMAFLADLKKNNDREWLKMHDPDYRQSWRDWESFVESLTEKILEVDETIPELPPKDLVFRIYRDVRFSSDPTPYKPLGQGRVVKAPSRATMSRSSQEAGALSVSFQSQHIRIILSLGDILCAFRLSQSSADEASFVAAGSGLWMPEASALAQLRRDIDRKSHKIKEVLRNVAVRKSILGGVSNDVQKVVKAFVSQNSESALKTKPKGYDADNANIELLRLRNFTMGCRVSDSEVLQPKGITKIVDLIAAMTPFVTYLNSVVMPDDDEGDDNAESSNESGD